VEEDMRRLIIAAMLVVGLAVPAMAETIHVGVDGLVCAFCVKGIESSFMKNEAVNTVEVDLDKKLVTLITKPDKKLEDAVIKEAITDAGYNVTNIHRQK
jgi:copper chaperone CopZ